NPCNDGNPCTTGEHCQFGFCGAGIPVNCDDNNPCTTEFCQPFFGCAFNNVVDSTQRNDHNPCTTDDTRRTGHCVGEVRNCLDDEPCPGDPCSSAGGAFLCEHEDCNSVPNSSCPAQCQAVLCGNGRLDPGETCDPPDPTLDPQRPGEVKCRPDCTYCGD